MGPGLAELSPAFQKDVNGCKGITYEVVQAMKEAECVTLECSHVLNHAKMKTCDSLFVCFFSRQSSFTVGLVLQHLAFGKLIQCSRPFEPSKTDARI